MFSIIAALTVGLLGLASAQSSSATTTSVYPYTITAGSVSPSISAGWCPSQMQSCLAICGDRAYPNLCDASSLTYSCTCTSGPTPDLTQYNETLPFFECQQYVNNCVKANETISAENQQECMAIKCGGKSPQAALSAYSSSLAAAASTSMPQSSGMMTTASSTVSPTASPSSPSKKNGGLAEVDPKTAYTMGTIVAGAFMFVGFVL